MDNVEYYLMNKDRKIAKLYVTQEKVTIEQVYGYIPPYIGNINDWLSNRLSPVGRANIITLLKYAQINTEDEFLFVSKAISLTDTFWVNNTHNWMKWSQVNPFVNRFSQIMSNIALNCEYNGRNCNFRSPSPEYTVDGSVHKCWKRENNEIHLYKTDGSKWSDLAGNRPYCEYYAHQVARALGIRNSVEYKMKVHKLNNELKPYVYCKIFTNEKYGYVPIGHTKFFDLDIQELIQSLAKRSIRDALKLAEMLLLDAIILNNDRHSGNYGFIFDNDSDTFNIVAVAPIFDNDMSLGAKKSIQNRQFKEVYEELLNQMPQTGSFDYIEQGKYALRLMYQIKDDTTGKTYGQIMARKMQSIYPFKFNRLPDKSADLSDNRIQFMEFIVNNQIREILSKN